MWEISSGSSRRVRVGPRNMKSMRPPLAVIFLWLIFTRPGGGRGPLGPPGSAAGNNPQTRLQAGHQWSVSVSLILILYLFLGNFREVSREIIFAKTLDVTHVYLGVQVVADPGFPRGRGANSRCKCTNLLFCKIFAETTWIWKNLDRGGVSGTSGSATACSYFSSLHSGTDQSKNSQGNGVEFEDFGNTDAQ